jgi:hypothetical protein
MLNKSTVTKTNRWFGNYKESLAIVVSSAEELLTLAIPIGEADSAAMVGICDAISS